MKRFIKHWLGVYRIADDLSIFRNEMRHYIREEIDAWKKEAMPAIDRIENALNEKQDINAKKVDDYIANQKEIREDQKRHALEIERGLRALEETNKAIQKILEGK